MNAAMGVAALAWAGLATLAACDLSDPDTETIAWEAQLVAAISFPELRGQAAIVTQLFGTDAGIGIAGADSGAVFTWRVRLGSCAAPGEGVAPEADYPLLTADERGEASAETELGPRLSKDSTYHAEVRGNAPDTARAACGDFVLK